MSIEDIRARLAECPIPEDAQADWRGTNHYEITTDARKDCGYWWLGSDDLADERTYDCSTESGKRLGAVLDYSVAYKRDVAEVLAAYDAMK